MKKLLVGLAVLLGCDDGRDLLDADAQGTLRQVFGEHWDDVEVFREGDESPLDHTWHVVLRGDAVVRVGAPRVGLRAVDAFSIFPALEELDVSHNEVTNLQGLAGLPRLRRLQASHNRPLTTAAALQGAPALEELFLDACGLTEASAVPDLPTLRQLGLSRNPLRSLEGLPPLVALENLAVAECGLSDLRGLGTRPALRSLAAAQNELTTLAGIEGATGLERLFADRNELTDASALAGLSSLRRVHLAHNQLATRPPLPEGAELEAEDNPFLDRAAQAAADAQRWVVAGIDLGPPQNPWVERLPGATHTTRNMSRSCRCGLSEVDCHITIGRLTGAIELEICEGRSSAPAGNLTVRVGQGRVRHYNRYVEGVYTMREATPEAPLETGGTTLPARFAGSRLGVYMVLIEAVDGPAEDVDVHFRTGFEP